MRSDIYVTFGGAAYDSTVGRIVERGKSLGATDVWVYDDAWLETTEFRRLHRALWEHPGSNGVKYGYGWYCWKPYVIIRAMERMHYSDVLLYTDGDTFPIADFRSLYDYCIRERGFFLFEASGCSNRQYVKRDCFEIVDPLHTVPIDSQHATGRFALFQKGRPDVETFLLDWLRFGTDPRVPTRDPSVMAPEYPGFEENRGDQSVLSILAHLYGIPLHREADAFGNGVKKDWGLYPQLFEQIYCQGDRTGLNGSKFANVPKEINEQLFAVR